jgi:hypothetical protein
MYTFDLKVTITTTKEKSVVTATKKGRLQK